MKAKRWQFWIDVGGTFTDCLAQAPGGKKFHNKILSSSVTKGRANVAGSRSLSDATQLCPAESFWDGCKISILDDTGHSLFESTILSSTISGNLEVADPIPATTMAAPDRPIYFQIDAKKPSPILAVHLLTSTPLTERLPECDVFLGTTKGTNALLTATGAKTALVTSKGLRDFLTIGDQARENLFDLVAQKRSPLFQAAIEIEQRILVDGTVEIAPDEKQIRQQLIQLKEAGIESLAVCLIHSFRFPAHEQLVAKIAREIGFKDVRISSDVAALIQLVARGETTVLDAYLNPVISDYLDSVQSSLGAGSQLKLMTSAGTLTTRDLFSGKDSVLSGPAGGVVGSARIAEQIGELKSIGFDMGGTSTDVSRYDGTFQLEYESTKAGVRILTPMMAIETVAAGGGSICRFDGTRLLVGPQSAGSDPGPACYGAGGPLTVTDINLFLGRLNPTDFPFELNLTAVEKKLTEIADQLAACSKPLSLHQIASGFLEIANHSMATAIGNISVAQGVDPRNYLLVSFGGAGGQHCCGVADAIEIDKILVHPQCSVLSAVGLQLSDQSYSQAVSILKELNENNYSEIGRAAQSLTETVRKAMISAGVRSTGLIFETTVGLRYVGTDSSIHVPQADLAGLNHSFSTAHQKQFGYVQDRAIEIVAVRVRGLCVGERLTSIQAPPNQSMYVPTAHHSQTLHFDGRPKSVPCFDWDNLQAGATISGPAVISNALTSTIVDPGWVADVWGDKQLLLRRDKRRKVKTSGAQGQSADPVELEIFNKSFESIAEQMGQVLQKTAISVNVKQRLDYSCAVFSETGDLVVNAPHIPVHLGAMSATVRATIELNPTISEGDVFITNDPYEGGSHLPDVTVVTPVFIEGQKVDFWVASRAHHAELGGISPGSMPAGATRLEQEGVIIRNQKLVSEGAADFEGLEKLLRQPPYPSRRLEENLADVSAQIAANQTGVNQLRELVSKHSPSKVQSYMRHIQSAAAEKARRFLASLPDGKFEFSDSMDDGTVIQLQLTVTGDRLLVDFTGTAAVHPGNLNANSAIVSSAVMYVMRCLLDEDIPLNAGILSPVTIILPDCFLNPTPAAVHQQSPAVVGGNVETSQRIVDVLFSALSAVAQSQGTMNNWLVGDDSFGYYETVGGGAGAGKQNAGADAVHCHMSNTRLTDPETLETRYPMILREFYVRAGSGGDGINRGGNGMIREIEFRSDLVLSLLTSRRKTPPKGLSGGSDGACGQNILIRNGEPLQLDSQCELTVKSGDRLRILTPGGGGYGSRESH